MSSCLRFHPSDSEDDAQSLEKIHTFSLRQELVGKDKDIRKPNQDLAKEKLGNKSLIGMEDLSSSMSSSSNASKTL